VDTRALVTSDSLDNSRWMAPELIQPELIGLKSSKPNKATDVWSYGMLSLEILTGKVPFHNRARSPAVISDIINGILPARPPVEVTRCGLSDELWDLIQQCWRRMPEHRPTMSEVMLRMKALENKQANSQWPYESHLRNCRRL
jgi:son of sevenless